MGYITGSYSECNKAVKWIFKLGVGITYRLEDKSCKFCVHGYFVVNVCSGIGKKKKVLFCCSTRKEI